MRQERPKYRLAHPRDEPEPPDQVVIRAWRRAVVDGYSASKAATHSITQALRAELRGRGIDVFGAYPGGIDTDMLAGVEADKARQRSSRGASSPHSPPGRP